MNPLVPSSSLRPPPSRQQGVVLAVGLVFLLVLTILGVTALRTTTLEERMAGNMQQRTLAFQDAEAKIAMLFNSANANDTAFSQNDTCSTTINNSPTVVNPGVIAASHVCRQFMGRSNPGRQIDEADGGQIAFMHFRLEGESSTLGNATVELQQGVYQRAPRAQNVSEER